MRTGALRTLRLAAAVWAFSAVAAFGQEEQAPEPVFEEAAALIAAGERDEAARLLNEFLVGRPWDVPAFHQVGAIWLLAGEPELAVPPLEGAVARAPQFVDSRLALGQALG
ncbi:MAG: hypothetical protein OYL41_07170, partial [Acidobacteriota bacterium]|nr:hypothetical protein [Acidobacteriota bacterium]